ncbi:MAG: hypothetical protein QOC92_3970 [Acidimicrobiaceae bacterium]
MSMIKGVWPGGKSTAVRQLVVQANWLTLPLAGGSCDLVFGDACFATVHRAQAREVAESIRRVLRSGGAFTTRMFVRPDIAEQPDDVWEQLVEGRIGNFAIFKLRLLMALCSDAGEVGVAEAWIYFRSRCPELPRLAEHLGWPVETVKTIEAYRDQSAIYWFPTVSEFRAVLANLFRERACRSPTYELGERCLTFVLAG